jgi:hypothetical protein
MVTVEQGISVKPRPFPFPHRRGSRREVLRRLLTGITPLPPRKTNMSFSLISPRKQHIVAPSVPLRRYDLLILSGILSGSVQSRRWRDVGFAPEEFLIG